MAAGCEFICKNEDCPNYETGFTITGPWPMGQISLIVRASNLKKMPEFCAALLEKKEQGETHACITLPNVDDIPVEAYRIQKWCNACSCVWSFAVHVEGDMSLEEAIEQSDAPEACPQCGGYMLDFERVIDEGLLCPSCNEPLFQSRWFSNEVEGDEDE